MALWELEDRPCGSFPWEERQCGQVRGNRRLKNGSFVGWKWIWSLHWMGGVREFESWKAVSRCFVALFGIIWVRRLRVRGLKLMQPILGSWWSAVEPGAINFPRLAQCTGAYQVSWRYHGHESCGVLRWGHGAYTGRVWVDKDSKECMILGVVRVEMGSPFEVLLEPVYFYFMAFAFFVILPEHACVELFSYFLCKSLLQ